MGRTHLDDGWYTNKDLGNTEKDADIARLSSSLARENQGKAGTFLDLSNSDIAKAAIGAKSNNSNQKIDSQTSQAIETKSKRASETVNEGGINDKEDKGELDFDDPDEEPDHDLLQDGQDQDPVDKARQIKTREWAEKQKDVSVGEIHDIVASVIAKSEKESQNSDISSNEAQQKSNDDVLQELLAVQKDLQRLAKPKVGLRSKEELLQQGKLNRDTLLALGKQAGPLLFNATQSKKNKGFSIAELSQNEAKNLVKHGKANYKIGNTILHTMLPTP